jgi:putative ABC transport system permease protein
LFRSLRARRARLSLALTAVSLGVAVATMLATLSLGVGDELALELRRAGPNFIVVPAGSRWPLDLGGASYRPTLAGAALGDTVVAALRTTFWRNNLLAAAPELSARARIGDVDATLIGTWFDHDAGTPGEPWRTGVHALRPHWSVMGRWPAEDADEIALGARLAAKISEAEEGTPVRAGDSVKIEIGGREMIARVSGIVSAGGLEDDQAWLPLPRLQTITGRMGQVDRVWLSALVKPQPPRVEPDAASDPQGYERWECTAYPANLARTFGERLSGAEVLPMSEVLAGEGRVVERLDLLMVLLGLAALTASTLGLLSTTAATVVERRVEIALMRSLGATSRQLGALLFGETLMVAALGGVVGWALGSLAARLVHGGSFGASGAARPLLLPVAVLLAILVATLGTLGPLRVALRIEPARVLRGPA